VQTVTIENGNQVPDSFGPIREAIRKSTVRIRQPEPEGETFQKSWGTLEAKPSIDLIIIQDSGDEYPIKRVIFDETYEHVGEERYRKKARSRLVQVPEGVVAILKTKEGDIEVRHPDFVVIGAQDEVYANRPEWVADNLEFVS
jgi:hypothetical protein